MTATKAQPMRAIHTPNARLYFLLAARDGIKSVSALQGRTFAVSRIGSADHSLSMLALKSLGFNPAGLKLIAMGVRPCAPRRWWRAESTPHRFPSAPGSPSKKIPA